MLPGHQLLARFSGQINWAQKLLGERYANKCFCLFAQNHMFYQTKSIEKTSGKCSLGVSSGVDGHYKKGWIEERNVASSILKCQCSWRQCFSRSSCGCVQKYSWCDTYLNILSILLISSLTIQQLVTSLLVERSKDFQSSV